VLRQHFVDQRLIPDFPTTGLFAKLLEHTSVDPNSNEPARFIAERRTANAW
jgi:hypothetical protein